MAHLPASSSSSAPASSFAQRPTLAELFLAFLQVSISGFGGALPWARRMIVDKRRWMTAEEFNEAFSLSQFLPGPNTVNFSVVFGTRFGGAAGAAVSAIGLLGPPLVIVTLLAVLYDRYGGVQTLDRILAGVAAAATGLLIANVAKMIAPLIRQSLDWRALVIVLAFIGVAVMRWPLVLVLAVLAPASIAIAWFKR